MPFIRNAFQQLMLPTSVVLARNIDLDRAFLSSLFSIAAQEHFCPRMS